MAAKSRSFLSMLSSVVFLFAAGAQAAGLDPESEIEPFVAEVAARHGLDEARVRETLSRARVLNKVLKAMSRPAEAKPWSDYRPIFLTDKRVVRGARYWREHATTLDDATKRYGVPQRVIVAIIGVETFYGGNAGNIKVLDALATLGFRYPKRARFFRRELEQFLLLTGEEAIDPFATVGSYAGAMGIGQFIPSSYREYAVDFDGDARRDLLGSHADAIGSVAAYLARHGWVRDAVVSVPARIEGSSAGAVIEKGVKPHASLADLAASGVVPTSDVSGAPKAGLIALEGRAGREHWLVFQNFYAITRYNRSKLYAMAVHQLSLEIESQYRRGGQ